MACTIDHLSPYTRATVIRGFSDARGTKVAMGENGLITEIELDWSRREIRLEWVAGGRTKALVFDLTATTGPGNGRMRDYFEASGQEFPSDPEKRFVEGLGLVSAVPPELPHLTPEIVRGTPRFQEALARVHALAGHRRFDEAREQLDALPAEFPDRIACDLTALAEQHAFDPTEGVYEWLRDEAIRHWYQWGAGATSGGEGSARLLEIRPAMERLGRLDRARQIFRNLSETDRGVI